MNRLCLCLPLFIFLLYASPSKGCKCAFERPLKELSQLDEHIFIARVLITDDGDSTHSPSNTSAIRFRITELFKGDSIDQLIEWGKNSSCDMGISTGEEWILFARQMNGKLTISACDRSVQYRNASGEKDWSYRQGFDVLDKLRELYCKSPYPDDKPVTFYSNGQKEQEAFYLNGKLHGERRTWYATGQLWGMEHFANGLPDGKPVWFYRSGQLMREEHFKAGKNQNVARTYYDTTLQPTMKKMLIDAIYKTEDSINTDFKRIQVEYERVYNADGAIIIWRHYYRTGQIETESIYGKPDEHGITIHYYNNGRIRYLSNTFNQSDRGLYQEFDEAGEHVKTGVHEADGTFRWITP